ncbi:hypothetical protein ABGB18_01385 [Nonomuraea sp. B12E4]|uniref:hypothetical protein n=1 Tax=Nonomuraea sp. B12E4 TaxID=3153564 RepID=UPI00325D9E77
MNITATAKARSISRLSLVVGAGIIAGIFTLNATPASADSTWDRTSSVSTSDDSTWDTLNATTDDSTWD